MTVEKRTWQRPELVVLVRSRPEEAVLTACKTTGTPLAIIEQGVQRNYWQLCSNNPS